MWVEQLVFYVFSAVLILASLMVVVSRNTMKSALFLVLAFFASAVLWIMLEAEFLGLVLIFVYVGAVMTLFLFVVMMLNLDTEPQKQGMVRYLPFGAIIVAMIVGIMIYAIAPNHFGLLAPAHHGAGYSNIKALGHVLYTDYVFPFEVAAVVLLVAMVSAISLTHHGKPKRKTQDVPGQVAVQPEDRLRVVDMPAQKRQDRGEK